MTDDSNPPNDGANDGVAGAGSGAAMQENLKSKSTWLRLVFMVVLYVLCGLASLVASFVVALGFLWVLFTGEANERLKHAGQGIANYVCQIIEYLTYNSEVRPFPFDAEWPSEKPAAPHASPAGLD